MVVVPNTMLAALYKPGHDKLVMDPNHPVQRPKHDEVLLKVSACGVCHSDTALLSGLSMDTRTYALGHEISGVPVELGTNVDPNEVKIGKLYGVLMLTPCAHGVKGQPAVFNSTGVGRDGGYAEYVTVKANQLVAVPDGVPAPAAAIALDAGITAFHAVYNVAGIREGTKLKVLLFGIGGLGHLAVQYAKHFGAKVYACDIKPEARKLALELGAVEAFDLIDLDQRTKEGFKVDITIDFVASSQTFNLAVAALAGNDVNFPSPTKAVIVGVSSDTLPFNAFNGIIEGVSVLTSLYGPPSAAKAALDLFTSGAVKARYREEPLSNVNTAIGELRAFEVTGRKVIVPDLF